MVSKLTLYLLFTYFNCFFQRFNKVPGMQTNFLQSVETCAGIFSKGPNNSIHLPIRLYQVIVKESLRTKQENFVDFKNFSPARVQVHVSIRKTREIVKKLNRK